MNGIKIYRSILLLVILFPLLLFSSQNIYVSGNSNDNSNRFIGYEHNLTQGFIDDSGNDREIFYWIQVSDIHLEMSDKGKETREAFQDFCNKTIPAISPAFILSTGDNVDGPLSDPSRPDNRFPSEEEYKFFHDTLEDNNLNDSYYYIGVGNHETYNLGLDRNFIDEYMREEVEYYFDVQAPGGNYRFISLDTTQQVGMGNPFDYWGEMSRDRLNDLEELINETPDNIDQLVLFGHHPIHHIFSDHSDSGKTFKDLMQESKASVYLCGHVHTKNTYWNHGYLSELVCPVFREEFNYRIMALDNGYYSFSEEISGEWPAVVLTNPISNLLYNDHTDYSAMKESGEIRVLIFDPEKIEEAYVKIDGQKIGDLTNQTKSLWTLTYDPEEYSAGGHEIEVIVESESGKVSKTISFNLENISPVQIGGAYKFLIAVDLFILLTVLMALAFIALYSYSVLPQIYYHFNGDKKKDLNNAKNDKKERDGIIRRHFRNKWRQAATLPRSLWLVLALVPLYAIFGPLFIGPFVNWSWGSVWFFGVYIEGTLVLDYYSFIWPIAFLLLFRLVQNFVIRSNKPNPNKLRYIPLILFYAVWIGAIYFYSGYFTLLVVLINPMILFSISISVYFIWQSRKLSSPRNQI